MPAWLCTVVGNATLACKADGALVRRALAECAAGQIQVKGACNSGDQRGRA